MPTLELNQIYLEIFHIHISHFDFDVTLLRFCDVLLNGQVTTSVFKNVLVTFLSDPRFYQFNLYGLKITHKISFVKKVEYSIWCARKADKAGVWSQSNAYASQVLHKNICWTDHTKFLVLCPPAFKDGLGGIYYK